MVRSLFVLLLVLSAGVVEAAPRRRSRNYTYSTPAPTTTRVESYTSFTPGQAAACNSSAQGVAEMMASRGVVQHFGGNSGYEGVGMGYSPEAALNNCCYSNNGWTVVDQGVATDGRGRWFACKRYGR